MSPTNSTNPEEHTEVKPQSFIASLTQVDCGSPSSVPQADLVMFYNADYRHLSYAGPRICFALPPANTTQYADLRQYKFFARSGNQFFSVPWAGAIKGYCKDNTTEQFHSTVSLSGLRPDNSPTVFSFNIDPGVWGCNDWEDHGGGSLPQPMPNADDWPYMRELYITSYAN